MFPGLLVCTFCAYADEPVDLGTLQVTSGRVSEALFAIPQPVTVITAEEISQRNPQVMTEAFRYEPGAFFQGSGPGQGIVIVRGLKGSEVLHLVDGMRLNNAFFRNAPSQYIALLDPQNVSQLELLRGPYATVYGSDAMGGVVQVLTPEYRFKGDGLETEAGVRAHYGSADLARSGRTYLAVGNKDFSVSGGVSFSEFGKRKLAEPGQSPDGAGGFTLAERVNDTDYRSRGYDMKAIWTPAEGHELMLAAQQFEIPELQRYFQTVPGFSGGAPARAIAEFNNDRTFYHLRYRHTVPLAFMDTFEVHLARQVITDDRRDRRQDNSRDEFTFNESTLDGLTMQADTLLGAHRLRYGIEIYTDRVDSSAYRETPPGSGTISFPNGTSFFSPFPDGSRDSDYGLYALDEWQLTANWMLESGLRYTRRDTHIAQGDRTFGAEFENDDFTGNLGSRLALSPTLAWTVNVGRGFRSPNLFDLAVVGQRANNRVVIANLDLKPESVVTVDTGFKFGGRDLQGDVTVFYSDYRDRIVIVNPAFAEGTPECPDDGDVATTGCAQNQNVAESRYYGLEAGTRYSLSSVLSLRGVLNYTWGDQERNGVKTPANRVPPLNGQVGAIYAPMPAFSVEPYVFFAGKQHRLDANDLTDSRINPSGTPGYANVNLRLGWEPTPDYRMQLEGNNLLDAFYREHGSGIEVSARGVALTVEARFR